MKSLTLLAMAGLIFSACALPVFAQDPTPPPAPAVSAPGTVAVAAPAAPPQWAQDLLTNVQALPVVGPWVTKAMIWLGIMASILTTLVAFLLGAVKALSSVANLAGLTNFAQTLKDFQNSQFMYWLAYFSNFNVQPPPEPGVLTKPPAAS